MSYLCNECIYWFGRISKHNDLDGKCHRYPTLVDRYGSARSCGELILKKNENLIDRIKNNKTLNDAYKKMKNAEHEFTMLEILSREDFEND